jgi:hypothetical protein
VKLRLYWAQTIDHHEDWFIVAQDVHEAERLHEEMEGYEFGDAEAEEILEIPGTVPAEPGWPSEELLEAIGARYIETGATRVVELNGRTFCEGMLEETIRSLDDDRFEAQGEGRINGTRKIPRTPQ